MGGRRTDVRTSNGIAVLVEGLYSDLDLLLRVVGPMDEAIEGDVSRRRTCFGLSRVGGWVNQCVKADYMGGRRSLYLSLLPVLQMVDLAGLRVGPPPHHSLHQEGVGDVEEDEGRRRDPQVLQGLGLGLNRWEG